MAGGSDPSHRFLDGGGEPADEVGSSSGERAPFSGGRELGAAELDVAAVSVSRREKEFWVAIPKGASGVVNDTFLRLFGILNTRIKGWRKDARICKMPGATGLT